MSQENVDKISRVVEESTSCKTKTNEAKPRSSIHEDSDAVGKEHETNNGKASKNINIGDVNVLKPYGNLHFGTGATFSGPVCITGLRKNDILSVNESCKTCKENVQKTDKDCWVNKFRIHKDFKLLNRKLNMRKCFILVGSLFLTQLIILPLFVIIRSVIYVDKLYSCKGIEAKQLSFFNRLFFKRDFISRKLWGYGNNCLFDCCIINNKSTIRFLIVHPNLLNVLIPPHFAYYHLEDELRRQMDYSGIRLNDIYYNYLIGFNDAIFEGRPLNCPFEEKMENLVEDHSNIITVGIPFCLLYIEDLKIIKSLLSAIDTLIYGLQFFGILDKNFTLEFPDICNGTTLLNMTVKDVKNCKRLIFYNYLEKDPFANDTVQSYEQLNRDITFLPTEEIGISDSKNLTKGYDSLNFPIPLSNMIDCNNDTDYFNISNTKQYFVIYEFRSYYEGQDFQELKKNFAKREEFLRYTSHSIEKVNNSFNYFVYEFDGATLKDTRTECNPTPQKIFNEEGEHREVMGTRSIINLIGFIGSGLVLEKMYLFPRLLKPILNDQRQFNPVIKYKKKHRSQEVHMFTFFIFPCLDYQVTATLELYQMFEPPILYHDQGKYWFRTYDECRNFFKKNKRCTINN